MTTPAKYLFKLVSETQTVICDPEPLEWKNGEIEYSRDLEVGGVFSTFHADSLTFVGNGADLLKKLFAAYEINAKCTLIIYWWKQFDLTDPAKGRQYVEFPSRFDINFNFYEEVKVGKFSFGIKVKAVNSSLQTKLDNRQDTSVNVMKLLSVGNAVIQDYPTLKKGLFFSKMYDSFRADLSISRPPATAFSLPHLKHKISFTAIPLNIDTLSDPFMGQVNQVGYVTQSQIEGIPPFFKNALFDYDFDLYYYMRVLVTNRYVGTSFPWYVQIIETTSVSGKPVAVGAPYNLFGFGGERQEYTSTASLPVHVSKGNSLIFVVQSPGIDATYYARILDAQIRINVEVISSPETLTEGIPIYEATERTLQLITDQQYPLYSDFLGRTDNQYNKFGAKYGTENQLRFAHIQSGLNQRSIKLDDKHYTLALNFKALFTSLKALYNVGYSLEINPDLFGDDSQRIRIEEYSHFFEDEELIFDPPLSQRISPYDIQSQVMPELVPVDIKTGFNSYEYLTLNGMAEPNTTHGMTSVMNTATKLEIISPFRGDTKGIIANLSTPVDAGAGTTDTKGEADIYIVKTQKCTDGIVGHDWKPEKGENISILNKTSLFGEDLMNRLYTPTRIMKRHGSRIKSGMTKQNDSTLIFQSSDKYCSLQTSDGTDTVIENANILVSELENPIFKPMKRMIECKFTFKDLELIQANPYKYIKFSDTISGYLLNLKKKNNEDKAEITIIEKY